MKLKYRIIYSVVRFIVKRNFRADASVEEMRASFRKYSALPIEKLRRKFPGVECTPFDMDGVPAEWMDAHPGGDKPIILYLHGGGYFMGGIDTHRGFMLRFSYRARVRICSIDYRLAPEHPHPAAVEDALHAYRWLRQRFPTAKIFIAGDSAGGGLTLATLLALRDAHEPLPPAAICISPWTDLAATGESITSRDKRDCLLAGAGVKLWRKYYAGPEKWEHPSVSPLYAELSGLPPLQILVGEEELLLDDSLRFAEKAKAAGVQVDLLRAPDMQHDWPLIFHRMPEAKAAIDRMKVFIEAH